MITDISNEGTSKPHHITNYDAVEQFIYLGAFIIPATVSWRYAVGFKSHCNEPVTKNMNR